MFKTRNVLLLLFVLEKRLVFFYSCSSTNIPNFGNVLQTFIFSSKKEKKKKKKKGDKDYKKRNRNYCIVFYIKPQGFSPHLKIREKKRIKYIFGVTLGCQSQAGETNR